MNEYVHIFQEMQKFGSSTSQHDLLYLPMPNVYVETLLWPREMV